MARAPSAPYATPSNVTSVIRRYRERGLPDPLTRQALVSLGIADSITSHVLTALRFLNLIDGEGHRTDLFERLRRATTEEYPETMAEVIRAGYHEVLTIVDPMQDSITAINDAFRHYEPAAQRERMVALFLGLCREASLAPDKRQRRPSSPARSQPSRPKVPPLPKVEKPGSPTTPATHIQSDDSGDGMPDYRLLNVLLGQLPREGHWTRDRRDRWIQAVTAAVDLVVEVEETN